MKYLIVVVLAIFFLSSCKFSISRTNDAMDRDAAAKVVDSFYTYMKQDKLHEALSLFNLQPGQDTQQIYGFLVKLNPESKLITARKLDHYETFVSEGLVSGCSYKMYYLVNINNMDLKVSISLARNREGRVFINSYQASPEKFI